MILSINDQTRIVSGRHQWVVEKTRHILADHHVD